MNNVWQLCVVDTDIFKIDRSTDLDIIDAIKDYGKRNNGSIVFVVGIVMKSFDEIYNQKSIYYDLIFSSANSFIGGVTFAYVYNPHKKEYRWVLNDVLKPILTKQDAVEAELKFGIDLKQYMS